MIIAISFIVYTLLIVGLGIYATRFASDTNEDYFLAGRSLGGWVRPCRRPRRASRGG